MGYGAIYATIGLALCATNAVCASKRPVPEAPSAIDYKNHSTSVTSARSPLTPSERPFTVDRQFLVLGTLSAAAVFADSYTTTWIGNNYRARGSGPCTVEGGEPFLYGTHPSTTRSYEVAASLSGGALALSYLAKRYLPMKARWLWPIPLLYETATSVHGFSTNLSRC